MRGRLASLAAMMILIASLAAESTAAELTIGAGTSLDLGSSNVNFSCADLRVSGTLLGNAGGLNSVRNVSILSGGLVNGGSGEYYVTGGWSNDGQFVAGTSAVNFVDGCAQTLSAIEGDTTFYDMEALTISGKVIEFEAGSTTTVTGDLIFVGVEGNPLSVRSSVAGAEAFLDIQGTAVAAEMEVTDNHATGNPIVMGQGAVGLSNTIGWSNDNVPIAVPLMGSLALVALAGCLLCLGSLRLLRPGGAVA